MLLLLPSSAAEVHVYYPQHYGAELICRRLLCNYNLQINQAVSPPPKKYAFKPLSMIQSRHRHVLFLDIDTIPLSDPKVCSLSLSHFIPMTSEGFVNYDILRVT